MARTPVRQLWLTLAVLAVTACGRTCAQTPAPLGQRLVELLPDAVEVPPLQPQREWLHVRNKRLEAGLGFYAAIETGRPFVVRARVTGPLEIRAVAAGEIPSTGEFHFEGSPPGESLGACLTNNEVEAVQTCQRYGVTSGKQVGLLILSSGGPVSVEDLQLLDSDLPDLRAPASPLLSRHVRRTEGPTPLGFRHLTGLAAPAEGRYVFDVALPPDATLRLTLGHEPGDKAAPMRFRVLADNQEILNEVVPPDGRLHDYERRLPSVARLRLTLEARGEAAGEHRGLWLNPRIVGRVEAPSVVLFSMDAVRSDHLSAYGYQLDTSPNLQKLIKFGTRFEASTAQAGSTWESVTSLLSGLYPFQTGVQHRGQYPSPDIRYLPDLFAARGYETFAGAQGADFPAPLLAPFDDFEYLAHPSTGKQGFHDVPPELLAKQVEGIIKRAGGRPFFLWIHTDPAHYPLAPSEPHRYNAGYSGRFSEHLTVDEHHAATTTNVSAQEGRQIVALYDSSVRDTDAQLGAILATLQSAGVLESTIIAATADHGTVLGQRTIVIDHTMPFNEVLNVPLVIAWPGGLQPQAPVRDRVASIDIAPTLLSLAGLAPEPSLDGRDLSPLLRGQPLPPRPAYSEVLGIFSMYDGNDHFIFNPNKIVPSYSYRENGIFIAERLLYDVAKDPLERHDLAAANATRTAELEGRLKQDIGPWLVPGESAPAALGQDALNALTQAGYLQAHP